MPSRLKHCPLNAISNLFCLQPVVTELPPEQLAALHVFKHEVLASGYRVYEKIDEKTAGPIIANFFKELATKLPDSEGDH